MKLLIPLGLKKPCIEILVNTEIDLENLYQQLAYLRIEQHHFKNDLTPYEKALCLPKIAREINSVNSDICYIRVNIHQHKGEIFEYF